MHRDSVRSQPRPVRTCTRHAFSERLAQRRLLAAITVTSNQHMQAMERRLLFAAQTVPPVGFFSADIQQPGMAPADFTALPTLNDSSAQLVKEQLANAQALGQTLAVRVDQPLTTKGAINTFDQFPIQYVFGDFYDANRVAETRDLGSQVMASRLSSSAVVGNFNLYPNAGSDPTRPASLAGSQAPRFPADKPTNADYANARSTNGAGNDQMGDPALWPGSPDYRNPAQGNSGAPNIRSALFTLPIQRETLNELGLRGLTAPPADASGFAEPGRPDAADDVNIPNVTRFNNYGNPALGGGPSGTGFVQNAATPSNGQLLSRGDFQAMILHYRLRGAFSVNLQDNPAEGGSVVGYSETQAQNDVKTGWSASAVVNGIAGRGNYSLANLTNTIGDSGGDSGDLNPRSTELSGTVWSGIYDNDGSVDENTGQRRMTILISNLSAVQRTIDLPDNIGGFSTFKELGSDSLDAPDDYLIDPGQHRLLNFALKTSSRGMTEWVFTGDQFIGLDNNRNGVGVGGPGQTFPPAGTQQFGSMKIDDAPSILETDAGQTFASFLVTRSGDTSTAASAQYFTIGGTATSGVDFEATSGEVDFAPNQTSKTILIKVNGDTAVEPDETFFVRLVSPFNATLEYDQGAATITNDDTTPPPPPLPAVSIGDVTQNEGNSGTSSFTFTVTRSGDLTSGSSVAYSTADDTATVADNDYQPVSNTIAFDPGQASKTITVLVNGDTKFEPNETFFVNLSSPAGATIADGQAVGTIVNDDTLPTLSIDDVSHNEGNSGTTSFTFTVTRSGDLSGTSTVGFATTDGTATVLDGDYQPIAAGMLTFAPGVAAQNITVLVNGDTHVEPDETFFVNLSGATGATVSDSTGQGTIKNDDSPVPPPPSGTVSVITDPCDGSKTALNIVGTSGSDTILVDFAGMQGRATVTINGILKGTFTFTGTIQAHAGSGNDKVTISSSITRSAFVWGEGGNDSISSGSGNDVLLGGSGNDTMKGNAGRDILVGGDGADKLDGGSGDDVLIAGDFKSQPSVMQLCSVLKEWSRTDKLYSSRVTHLTSGGGFNTIKLNATTLFSSSTLRDSLTGGSDKDLFYAASSGDVLTDKGSNETKVNIG